MSNPKAEIQITAESRTLGAKLREARAQLGKFGGALKKEVFGKAIFDSSKASAHMVGQLGASAVGRGVGFLEDQARGVLDFNEQLLNFQLAARRTPEEAQAIGQAARQVAADIGLGSETVLAGEKAFVDLAGAENGSIASMRTLARTAKASNTEIGAMATVMYALQNSLHVRPEEMEDTLSGLINQSKDGTIHFANMAEEIIGIAPKFARFGVTGREGANQLGAMFQVIRSGSKGAEETTTKIDGIFRGLIRNADKFHKGGVNVFNVAKDGTKTLKPFAEIWASLEKSKLMKDPQKLIKTFGRGDGEAGMRLLIELRQKFDELVEAGRVNGTVQQDLATIASSASGRMASAMERVKNSVADAMTPERINAFVTALEGAAEKVGPLAESVGKLASAYGWLFNAGRWLAGGTDNANPWKGEGNDARSTELQLQRRGFRNLEDAAARGVLDKGAAVAMRGRIANQDAYDAAVKEIVDGGDPDHSTPESIRRAAIASHSDVRAPGGAGRVTAAEKYLENAHVGRQEAEKIFQEALDTQNKALQALLEKVTAAIQKGFATSKTEVKADGKAIVDVHRGSSAHAKRPGA